MSVFTPEVIVAAKKHAREMYPEESCGIVVQGEYLPFKNVADDPSTHNEDDINCGCRKCCFILDPKRTVKYIGRTQAIIHSHPDGLICPSQADMEGQITTNLPWAIVPLDEDRVYDLTIWGEGIPPLLGREFVHGTSDCLSLIRDAFRLGADELAKQGIPDWPYPPVDFADIARQDAWWNLGENLYIDNFAKWGFEEIKAEEARPGDVFLMKLRSKIENHGGLLVSPDLILHHLPQRLSLRAPSTMWVRAATTWLRYKGFEDA